MCCIELRGVLITAGRAHDGDWFPHSVCMSVCNIYFPVSALQFLNLCIKYSPASLLSHFGFTFLS